MTNWKQGNCFIDACGIDVSTNIVTPTLVSIIGAGGKTSLLFYLANEAKKRGKRVLVTTTTRMWVPDENQYDLIDISESCFAGVTIPGDGCICVAGVRYSKNKIGSVDPDKLKAIVGCFDLVLIEADGAAGKRLKGWRETEPVVLPITDITIGVLDIGSVGLSIDEQNIHRLELFNELTSSQRDTLVTVQHLIKVVEGEKGLFAKASKEKVLFFNKMENPKDFENGDWIKKKLNGFKIVGGSVRNGKVYV